jgi:hypothetical protein
MAIEKGSGYGRFLPTSVLLFGHWCGRRRSGTTPVGGPIGSRRKKAGDHSGLSRFSAWRRYHVRRDISSFSQGFLASFVLWRSPIRGRPVLRRLCISIGSGKDQLTVWNIDAELSKHLENTNAKQQ